MEKIKKLRFLFNKSKIDGYIIPKNDEFFGEYISEDKDNLKFISNFSGSFGLALILKKINYLFVDGRYTVQAKNQSKNKFTILTIPNQLPFKVLKKKKFIIGFDPKLHTEMSLKHFFQKTNCNLRPVKNNLIEEIKHKKTKNKFHKFYSLNKKFVGEDSKKKITQVSKMLIKNNVNAQFISSSENIAWLLNIRGKDSNFSPLPNSYLIIDNKKNVNLFCNLKKINEKFRKNLKNIKIKDINCIDQFLINIEDKKIQIDKISCSIYFKNLIMKKNYIFEKYDPIYYLKSIKNKIEIKNTIKTHIYDGVALTKFLFWIKNNFKKKKITEINAANKLFKFRAINSNFKFQSFPTISGSGPNGAIIHYKASLKSNRLLQKGDLYLVDSGGQYSFGTTDVTRTISLDNNDKKIKDIYTRVLKGHIAVAIFKLKKDTTGSDIDFLARKPLKEINLDYPHGTGHGVGYFLNVHEGPQAISKGNKVNLKEGMILSNEPGYYEPGKFGIRIENLLAIKKVGKSNKFINLTMAPIDKSLIEKKLLNKNEIEWINSYHDNVFSNLRNFMNQKELKQLKTACSNL